MGTFSMLTSERSNHFLSFRLQRLHISSDTGRRAPRYVTLCVHLKLITVQVFSNPGQQYVQVTDGACHCGGRMVSEPFQQVPDQSEIKVAVETSKMVHLFPVPFQRLVNLHKNLFRILVIEDSQTIECV